MGPRNHQNAPKFTPGDPTGAGGYPWRPQGYPPPDLKVSNFDENITEILQKIQKYIRKCYRKSAVVAPLHTHKTKTKHKYTRNCYRKSAVVAPLHMDRKVKFTTEHQQTLH